MRVKYSHRYKCMQVFEFSTHIVWIVWIVQIMRVNTCIICIVYASNSKYLLALFILFAIFAWNMRVIASIYLNYLNYSNYASNSKYLITYTCIVWIIQIKYYGHSSRGKASSPSQVLNICEYSKMSSINSIFDHAHYNIDCNFGPFHLFSSRINVIIIGLRQVNVFAKQGSLAYRMSLILPQHWSL